MTSDSSKERFPVQSFTTEEITNLAATWYRMLDIHAPLGDVLQLVADEGFEIRIPEGTFRGHDGFKQVYEEKWIRHFFDEVHTLKQLSFQPSGENAEVKVVVNWQARSWDPPEAKSKRIDIDAYQTWIVQRSPNSGRPVILAYTADALKPASSSDSTSPSS